MKPTTYVGMDVHKKTNVIAILRPDRTKPVEMQVPNDATGIRKLIHSGERVRSFVATKLGLAVSSSSESWKPLGFGVWSLLRPSSQVGRGIGSRPIEGTPGS